MNIFRKIFIIINISFIFLGIFKSNAKACTYRSTITNNHLDFSITSDTDKLAVVQYIRLSGNAIVTHMTSPIMSSPWSYFDDPYCNVYVDFPIACRQIRGSILGTGAFWQWSNNGFHPYNTLPSGIWGLDFNSTPEYDSIGIEYGTTTGEGDTWQFCTRVGDVIYPTPTPLPTTKVILAPGLTASWNADAILNCKTSGYQGEWILAPYAEEIYTPVIETLESNGWTTIPFYYDWRSKISKNSESLENFIEQKIEDNEKVNFIGHSMGGLLGRNYLENSQDHKLDNLLTIGSPNMGSALAYPPWEGGDIWNSSFIEKIALTLYLKRCGNLFSNDKNTIRSEVPSLQDLLPTYEYLQKIKTTTRYSPTLDENRNTWLENLSDASRGVRLGYIAGTGIDTLLAIQTKDPSKNNIRNNVWEDGKPAGKIFTSEGDGTVTLSSSILPNAMWSAVINQDHRNLISSEEGISKVLEFLDNSSTDIVSMNREIDSALILVGYPSNFSVVSSDGEVKYDKNNMIAIMNPKAGIYKVNILSQTKDTLFIVAQFLPNGEIKYKEYTLKGLGPKFKKLKYSIKNPLNDPFID